jgi:copper homeostasis protein
VALLEVCVDGIAALAAAQEAGAGRIELCARLDLDGLSPGAELLEQALAIARVPVCVMVRPRAGEFVLRAGELERMAGEVRALRERRVAGVVLGLLTPAGEIYMEATRKLVELARPLQVTFHRAFDSARDPAAALERLIELGVDRVLTSGGAPTAWEGRATLRALVEQARGRISVMAGGKVRADHAQALLDATGVDELHASVPFQLAR